MPKAPLTSTLTYDALYEVLSKSFRTNKKTEGEGFQYAYGKLNTL